MDTSTNYYSTTKTEPILDDFYNTSTTAADPPCQAQYCWERLPCGICRRTNRQCPYGGYNQYEIVWT